MKESVYPAEPLIFPLSFTLNSPKVISSDGEDSLSWWLLFSEMSVTLLHTRRSYTYVMIFFVVYVWRHLTRMRSCYRGFPEQFAPRFFPNTLSNEIMAFCWVKLCISIGFEGICYHHSHKTNVSELLANTVFKIPWFHRNLSPSSGWHRFGSTFCLHQNFLRWSLCVPTKPIC